MGERKCEIEGVGWFDRAQLVVSKIPLQLFKRTWLIFFNKTARMTCKAQFLVYLLGEPEAETLRAPKKALFPPSAPGLVPGVFFSKLRFQSARVEFTRRR